MAAAGGAPSKLWLHKGEATGCRLTRGKQRGIDGALVP
jgi:hypothetical protein